MKKFIIIPGCCDLNRGDQALGWETAKIAKDAGFIGEYSILAEKDEPIKQSEEEGFKVLLPVLEHPSRKFKDRNNIVYKWDKKIKWGLVAVKDFLFSFFMLNSFVRMVYKKFSKNEKKINTINFFEEADAIFMKGGGLIQSHGGIVSTYATYYRLYHIILAHSMKKPVYIMPNSYGPFKGPFVKTMVKRALKKCKLVTTREQKSCSALKNELDIESPCFPDLAFYLENGKITKNELAKILGISENKKIVAITMRPYRFPKSENPELAYNSFKNEMKKFILWLNSNNYIPLIIEHTFAVTSHESDGSCINDVIMDLDKNTYCFYSNRNINCRELKSLYGACDYIIGTRFHSLIFSLSNYVPGIAISYDGYKSIGIMKDMNLEEFVIDIGEVSSEILIEKFDKLLNNELEVKANIKKYINYANKERKKLIGLMKGE